ncbi:MAG: hypothetical protein H0X03_04615 [Nitrosopumilus sp.]|nr:hypothetical protein [Nitrosopumilus sp.]
MKTKLIYVLSIIATSLGLMLSSIGIEAVGQKQNSFEILTNQTEGWMKNFNLQNCDFNSTGQNNYFILKPGHQIVLEGQGEDSGDKLTMTVLNDTKMVNGTETRIVEEIHMEEGKLVEMSINYFAACGPTNDIIYFGEITENYKDGTIINHSGSWEAGIDNAKAGMMMPGKVEKGLKYYQEIAPGIAEDRAEIVSLNEVVETPSGKFENVLKTEETNPLKPGEKEFKFYAPGIGQIQDETLKLVKYVIPNVDG